MWFLFDFKEKENFSHKRLVKLIIDLIFAAAKNKSSALIF